MDRWRVRNRNVHFSPIDNVNYTLSTPQVEDQDVWYLVWAGYQLLEWLEWLERLLFLCLDLYSEFRVLDRDWNLRG